MHVTSQGCGIVRPCCAHGGWHWLSVGRRCAPSWCVLQPLLQLPRTLSDNGNAGLTPRWHWHSARSAFMRWHNPRPCHLPPLTAAPPDQRGSSAFKAAFSQCHQASERVALTQWFLNPLKELKSMQLYYTKDNRNYLHWFCITERMRPSFIFKFCHYMAGRLCLLIITRGEVNIWTGCWPVAAKLTHLFCPVFSISNNTLSFFLSLNSINPYRDWFVTIK